MKKAVGFLVALYGALVLTAPAEAKPVISLDDCLDIAEEYHPGLAGADGQIAAQRGRLGQTAASDRPEISGRVSASRSNSGGFERESYSAGATASVRVFDANRGKYAIDAQRVTLSAAEEDRLTTLRDVRANVKSAYMTLLLDMEVVGHRLESVRAFERYLDQAEAFYEAGIRPWYNVTKAEVDLGKAQLALIEAESSVEMSKVSLFNAMGIDRPGEEFDLAPIDLEVRDLSADEADILTGALENRSDYRASELKIMAGTATLKNEARASSPSVSVSGGYSGGGGDVFDLDSEWNVGVGITIPIVDGGATRARVAAAEGQLVSLEASREKLRQDIALEVRKILTDIARSRERIRISELNVASAEENRRVAVGRYETGAGDPFEVTDALLSFTEAQLENRRAKYDMQLALVALERATGKDVDLK
ncbi:MAG: TolC family protein [Synergistaceae bacterium]|nr:TolC family protein [Synergistaceae bacterium]